MYNKIMNSITNRGKSSRSLRNAGSSSAGSVNRDPKAFKVQRAGYQINDGGGRDDFEEPHVDFEVIKNAYDTDSYIMQAFNKYAELMVKEGYHFEFKNEQAKEYLDQRIAFMEQATEVPFKTLIKGIATDIVKFSNAFIIKARARRGIGIPPGLTVAPIPPSREPIAGYFRVQPDTMKIAIDERGQVLRYEQEVEGGGDPLHFAPEDVIHIKVNDTGRPFGHPWIVPVLEDIRLLRRIEQNISMLLYRHTFPLLTYQVGLDKPGLEASDEEIANIQQTVQQLSSDEVLFLPERHKVEAIKIDAIDGKPYLDYFENRAFSGLGMSQVDMGRGDTANRNTANAMEGAKVDRIKGWQQEIQPQIDHKIIDELLIEGGFDPLINEEFNIDFLFNEIEQEKRIAQETHAFNSFNNNAITYEELRTEIGREPEVDEARLQFNMMGNQTDGTVENQMQPQNQNGTRSGPKSNREYVQESLQEKHNESLLIYGRIKSDLYDAIEQSTKKDKANNLTALSQGMIHIQKEMKRSAYESFSKGIERAKKEYELSRSPYDLQESQSFSLVDEHIRDFVKEFSSSLTKSLKQERDLFKVKSVLEQKESQLKRSLSYAITKAESYAYALVAFYHGESSLSINPTEGSCSQCKMKAEKPVELSNKGDFTEMSLYYKIPPWHYHCGCKLTKEEVKE